MTKSVSSEALEIVNGAKFERLHLFTTHGKTYTFHKVSDFHSNESMIVFAFESQSDGEWKDAEFRWGGIVGYTGTRIA